MLISVKLNHYDTLKVKEIFRYMKIRLIKWILRILNSILLLENYLFLKNKKYLIH